jgi:hypothetical protein
VKYWFAWILCLLSYHEESKRLIFWRRHITSRIHIFLTIKKSSRDENMVCIFCGSTRKKPCPPCKSNSGWQADLAKKFPSPLRCAACPTASKIRMWLLKKAAKL